MTNAQDGPINGTAHPLGATVGALLVDEVHIDNGAAILRLAALDVATYERQRAAAAEMLGMRVGILDRLVAKERAGPDVLPTGSAMWI